MADAAYEKHCRTCRRARVHLGQELQDYVTIPYTHKLNREVSWRTRTMKFIFTTEARKSKHVSLKVTHIYLRRFLMVLCL